ncbi:hypothetical protein IQ07DRAFT_578666 [Pyrenochaeta sp. DS3sAY3a]|nr:hypothetical protein IQ07DRAFT_578666 [Pyrenochaeta sp. DS3sAY3a]
MRSFTSLVITLFVVLASAFAIPAPQVDPATGAAKVTHLYICTNASFQGSCANLHFAVNECHNLEGEFIKSVSSVGPDEGTFCTLYSDLGCIGAALPFTYPGIRDLNDYGYDNAFSSARCDFIAGWSK